MSTENMPKKSNTGYYIAAAVIVIVIIVVGVVAYYGTLPSPNPTPSPSGSETPSPSSSGSTTSMTVYAGEVSASAYGFGSSSSSISSPGPTLTFKTGQVVTITLVNSSPSVPHNFAIVDAKSSTANVVFNAKIQSASNPVAPGGSSSVTFTVGQAGTYYYICQVPGHVALGMWGTVTVTA